MTTKTFAAHLKRLDACKDARLWARGKAGEAAWRTCRRGDWLLWLAARAGVSRQEVVLAACACARLALPHTKKGEERPRITIETAEKWARGEAGVTLKDVRAAVASLGAQAADTATYAAFAAYAAACAAFVAGAAACAHATDTADWASDAATYAAFTAGAAGAAVAAVFDAASTARAARTKTLRVCADLVRKQIPWSVVRDALAAQGRGP